MYPSIEALSSNPERLVVLFSPFRPRNVNSDHYDEKMKFWRLVVQEFGESERKICFTMKDIEQELMAQCNRKPACLQEVFLNMTRDGLLVPCDEYVASLPARTWFAWSVQKIKQAAVKLSSYNPVTYDLSRIRIEGTTKFVYAPHIQSQIERILSMPALINRVKSVEEFKKEVALETGLEDEEMELIMKCLTASGRLMKDSIRDQLEVVKLVPVPNSVGITQVEKGKFDIQRTTQILEQDLTNLMEERDHRGSLAKASLKDGKRATAKSHLKVQKMMDKRIEKISGVLDTLTSIAIQIDGAESDAKVLKAYEIGKETLSQIFQDHNINADRVADVMLDIKDLLDEQEDISASISQPMDNEDSSLLEQELEQLMKEEEDERKEASKDAANESDMLKKLDKLTITGVIDFPSKPERSLPATEGPI